MATRTFTITELAELNVPPDDPNHIEYEEHVLADEQIAILKYTAKRRVVFRHPDDDKTYAVDYEAPIDTGDYETGGGMPDNHGWYRDTVEAIEVEQQPVTVMQWQPID